MKAMRFYFLTIAVAVCSCTASAQTYAASITYALEQLKKGPYVNSSDTRNCSDLANRIVALECRHELEFLRYFDHTEYGAFLQAAEETLSSHPPGASAGSAGSSSLVTKAAVPEVLGLAVDAGALTQSTSGSTTTFTGNARGLYRFLTKKDVFTNCPSSLVCDGAWSGAARRLSGSLSLDNTNSSSTSAPTSGTTTTPAVTGTAAAALSGSSWRMSSWGIQYQMPLGKFDTSGPQFRKLWDRQLTGNPPPEFAAAAQTLNASMVAALEPLETSPEYKAWLTLAEADIAQQLSAPQPSGQEIEKRLRAQLDELVKLAKPKISSSQVKAAFAAYDEFMATRDNVVQLVTGMLPGLSFAYTNLHPLNQANVSNFKLIFQIQPAAGKVSLTANVAADIYDALPAGSAVGRWRDFQVAAQADYTIPTRYGNPVLSAAGYYQYMAAPAVLQIAAGSTAPGTNIQLNGSAPALLAPRGNIEIFQAMLTFPVKNSTTKIPIGISWSNRTELLTGHVIRAHIGVNFDFDSLFMK